METDIQRKKTLESVVVALRNSSKGKLLYNGGEGNETKDIIRVVENLSRRELSCQGLDNFLCSVNNDNNQNNKRCDVLFENIEEERPDLKISVDFNSKKRLVSKKDEKAEEYWSSGQFYALNRIRDYENRRKNEIESKMISRKESMERKSKILYSEGKKRMEIVVKSLNCDSRRQIQRRLELDKKQIQEMYEQERELKEYQNCQAKRLEEKVKREELKSLKEIEKEYRFQLETFFRIKEDFFALYEMLAQILQNCPSREKLKISPRDRLQYFQVLQENFAQIEAAIKHGQGQHRHPNPIEEIKLSRLILDKARLILAEVNQDVSEVLLKDQKELLFQREQFEKEMETRKRINDQSSINNNNNVEELKNIQNEEKMENLSRRNESSKEDEDDDIEFVKSLILNQKEWENDYKSFRDDSNCKKYQIDLRKAVSMPVNSLSSVSGTHLRDKLEKLQLLLSGRQVKVGLRIVSTDLHPLASKYCVDLLAKTIVSQVEVEVGSNPRAAFPLAAIAVTLWSRFPKFGELLLAHLFVRCPYLTPKNVVENGGEEAISTAGYLFFEGKREEEELFLKRMTGLVRFYAALLQTSPFQAQKRGGGGGGEDVHPHSIGNGWKFLSQLMNVSPIAANVTATLLFDFLEVAGNALSQNYGKQFNKMLHILCKDFYQKLKKVTPQEKSSALGRLQIFLHKCVKCGKIAPPAGIILPSFWHSS